MGYGKDGNYSNFENDVKRNKFNDEVDNDVSFGVNEENDGDAWVKQLGKQFLDLLHSSLFLYFPFIKVFFHGFSRQGYMLYIRIMLPDYCEPENL